MGYDTWECAICYPTCGNNSCDNTETVCHNCVDHLLSLCGSSRYTSAFREFVSFDCGRKTTCFLCNETAFLLFDVPCCKDHENTFEKNVSSDSNESSHDSGTTDSSDDDDKIHIPSDNKVGDEDSPPRLFDQDGRIGVPSDDGDNENNKVVDQDGNVRNGNDHGRGDGEDEPPRLSDDDEDEDNLRTASSTYNMMLCESRNTCYGCDNCAPDRIHVDRK